MLCGLLAALAYDEGSIRLSFLLFKGCGLRTLFCHFVVQRHYLVTLWFKDSVLSLCGSTTDTVLPFCHFVI